MKKLDLEETRRNSERILSDFRERDKRKREIREFKVLEREGKIPDERGSKRKKKRD